MRQSKTSLLLGSISILSIALWSCGAKAPDLWFCRVDSAAFFKTIDGAQSLEDAKKYAHQFKFFYCSYSKDGKSEDRNLDQVNKERHISQPLIDAQKARNYCLQLAKDNAELEDKLNHCK